MSSYFLPKFQNFVYKGFTKVSSDVTLDRQDQFELLYAMFKIVVVIRAMNVHIIYTIMIRLTDHIECVRGVVWVDFYWCFLGPKKTEKKYQRIIVRRKQLSGVILAIKQHRTREITHQMYQSLVEICIVLNSESRYNYASYLYITTQSPLHNWHQDMPAPLIL